MGLSPFLTASSVEDQLAQWIQDNHSSCLLTSLEETFNKVSTALLHNFTTRGVVVGSVNNTWYGPTFITTMWRGYGKMTQFPFFSVEEKNYLNIIKGLVIYYRSGGGRCHETNVT